METTTALAGKPGLSIAVCWRPVPARAGEEHAITKLLRQRGNRVLQTRDSHLDLEALDVVLVLENCGWFPTILGEFKAARKDARLPLLAVWHWEPLPLPKAAGRSDAPA